MKIIKNRLRSSLCDDMLSVFLVLASEKDLLAELSNISIISRLAVASSSLSRLYTRLSVTEMVLVF